MFFGPLERSQMQAIGIEKGEPFSPDEHTQALLSEAARLGGAMARANTYASASPGIYYYPDRKWQQSPGGLSYTFTREGAPQIDARNNVYYMAAGNSPSMMEKNVRPGVAVSLDLPGCGWKFPRRSEALQTAHSAGIPANNFWSVVVYDALSRSGTEKRPAVFLPLANTPSLSSMPTVRLTLYSV
ncbi:MAG: hypothetical protein WDN30_03735 [Pararobbsia sp.]